MEVTVRKTITLNFLFIFFSLNFSICYAGLHGTTVHSRANCATFVESVTWNARESHWWRVKSLHSSSKYGQHMVDTQMAFTWRAAAYHVGESMDLHDLWTAEGYHFYMDNYGRQIYDAYTISTDCSAYDGWWG